MILLAPSGGDDATRLQSALDADDVTLGAGVFTLSHGITITRAGTALRARRGADVTLSWPALGANATGVAVTGPGVTLERLTLRGPKSGVYIGGETLVQFSGQSVASRIAQATVTDCAFQNVGSYGLRFLFADQPTVSGCSFTGIGYAGIMALSSNRGTIAACKIASMGPGTAGNSYGIALTHDSTGWPGTRVAQPFCDQWTVDSNSVDGVAWEGIDSHGGSAIKVTNNRVTNCRHGIAVASSSGGAADYAGQGNVIRGNTIDGGTRANTGSAIIVNGGAVEQQTDTLVQGNRIMRHGVPGNQYGGAILASHCRRVTIDDNDVDAWGSSVVYMAGVIDDVKVTANWVGSLASANDTFGYAVYSDAQSGILTVRGNAIVGTGARRGMQAAQHATQPTLAFNDFGRATEAAYVLFNAGWAPP